MVLQSGQSAASHVIGGHRQLQNNPEDREHVENVEICTEDR